MALNETKGDAAMKSHTIYVALRVETDMGLVATSGLIEEAAQCFNQLIDTTPDVASPARVTHAVAAHDADYANAILTDQVNLTHTN